MANAVKSNAPTVSHAPAIVNPRPKVAIGHPWLGFGGSEIVLMWLVEALKSEYDITIITTGGWNLDALNAFCGTRVTEDEVTVRIAPVPRPVRNQSAAAFRGACFQRFARQIACEYDIRISAYNPTDWGMPAVHFIADFSWQQQIRERFDPPTPGFVYRDSPLRKAYLRLAASYAQPSSRDIVREDTLIANSFWSARLIKEYYGVECKAVVYPAVPSEFPEVAWEEKEQAFVMIGRIAPEKKIEQAISILESVRAIGHAIRLHLCGEILDDAYGRRIARLCEQHAEWIIPEGRVSGVKKVEILSQSRFGIQMRAAEPFGISVAEMVKAGAIVFAPNDGGQAEILDHPDLLFADACDSVKKIVAVLTHRDRQNQLRKHLAQQMLLFGASSFAEGARKCVADFLAHKL